MIRTQIVPNSNNISVDIPDNYIGKKVEVILFSEDDIQGNSNRKGEIKSFKGMLSKEKASELQKFALRIRKEWDRQFLIDTNTAIDYLAELLPPAAGNLIDIVEATISVVTRIEPLAWPMQPLTIQTCS